MFKQNFINICTERGIAPTAVLRQIGLSNATFSCWTEDSVPRQTTLKKIADYFGITPEDLLRDPAEKPEPAPTAPDDSLLDARFYELLDKLTLKELRQLKADLEEITKDRR
jgi:transcriptional regulator with XRE-family HTH domain